MIPTRIEHLKSKYAIRDIYDMENSIPYTPKENEVYTHAGVIIKLFWISSKVEHFHNPDGIRTFEVIRLISEFENGEILDMITSSYKTLTVSEILGRAGIRLDYVERENTRQVNQSIETSHIPAISYNIIPGGWLGRFASWIDNVFPRKSLSEGLHPRR